MPPAKRQDRYSNMVKKAFTMSAANTLTFDEIEIGLNLFDKVGLIIHRIAYHWERTTMIEVKGSPDDLAMALVSSNQISSINPNERSVIDHCRIGSGDVGTPGNAWLYRVPLIHDFTTLPGGGLLVPPKPLYVAGSSTGMSIAGDGDIWIYFTILQLKESDYFELLETYRFFE